MEYVTQRFQYLELLVYRSVEGDKITQQEADEIRASLEATFPCAKGSYVTKCEIKSWNDEDDTVSITLGSKDTNNFDPYFEVECEAEEYIPAHIDSDPYYSHPAEDGYIDCYDSSRDMLKDKWKCPEGFNYETDDEVFEDADDIGYRYDSEKVDGPDPDMLYESWKDEMLFGR